MRNNGAIKELAALIRPPVTVMPSKEGRRSTFAMIASLIAILPALEGTPPTRTLLGLGVMVILIALNSLLWAFIGYIVGYRRRSGFGV